MNILEMTDSELYEMGFKVLADKLGASEVPRFIRQCQPGKGDYSVARHKLLENQPDIDTIVKRIQDRRAAREAEERERAKRFTAPQSEIRKMADLEVFEIGNQILIDRLGVAGLIRFITQCQELNGSHSRDLIENEKDAEERIRLYTAVLTLNPRTIETYIRRGSAYSYIRDYDKAIADFSEAIKIKPDYAKAYYNRGKFYVEVGEYDKTIGDFNKAIIFKPAYAEAYYNRGSAYLLKNEFDLAINDYSKVIELNPNDVKAYCKCCEIWLHLKEWEKTKAALTIARNIGVDVIALFYQLYGSVANYEQRYGVQLSEDIRAMLTQR